MELKALNKTGIYRINLIISALFLLVLIFMGATYDEIVSDKNKQIGRVNKLIGQSNRDASGFSNHIASINRSIDSVNTALKALATFLKDYKGETYLSANQIAIETNMVIFLEEDVDRIQKSLKNKIISLYKHGKNYDFELLLSSKSPNEFLRRNEYLQKFAQNRKKQLQELRSKEYTLAEKKKMLDLSTSSRRFYVESKRNEQTALQQQLKNLQNEKSNLEFQSNSNNIKINRLEMQLNSIKCFLQNFKGYKDKFNSTKTARLSYSSENFDSLKSKLNSPLDISLIRNGFGPIADNATNTQSFNHGIDFSVAYGSRVFAAAAGTVALVGETPYYGRVVILKHTSGYYTVYAEMSEITVKPGDRIRLNQVIGKSGENIDGQGLHFEIWQGKTPLNPAEWIRF